MNGNRIHEESLLVSFDCEAVSSCEQRRRDDILHQQMI